MLKLGERKYLVEDVMELPRCAGARRLHMGFETNSFTPKRPGDNPWAGDRIAGAAVTWDDHADSYYVPIRHNGFGKNLPVEGFQRWLQDVVPTCAVWSNHNVKFDAHFADHDGALFTGELFDTLTFSKLIDSDRGFGRGGYGLDALSSDWLDAPIDLHDQEVQAFLKGIRSKNYADVPVDIMGTYACQDVLTARDLDVYEHVKRGEYAARIERYPLIWDIERRLTPVLFDMERAGIRVDPQELQVKQLKLVTFLCREQEELHRLVEYPVDPSNSGDCYEVLCNRFGLPVLGWTDADVPNPSFDKHTLKAYLRHPDVLYSPKLTEIVQRFLVYRTRSTMLTFFVEPYLKRQVGGRLHPSYNQMIRTGRMSTKAPNSSQLNSEAKELVHPDTEDDAFLCMDASQIEFRLIAHYSGDRSVLDAYARDPDTDFHQWVADMCGIKRRPAKNVNFCVGYGGGKKKVLAMLSGDVELVGSLMGEVDKLIADGRIPETRRRDAFETLATARAEQVYREYHAMLPGLRRVTDRACKLVQLTGYVFNEYGRPRHLPEQAAWRAFNSLTQGLASDIIKGGMVALAPRYCKWTRDVGLDLRINVHDELVWHGPAEVCESPEVHTRLAATLEAPLVPLRVPLRFGCEVGRTAWEPRESVKILRDERAVEPTNVRETGQVVLAARRAP